MKEGGLSETLYESYVGKGDLTIKNLVKGLRINLNASRRAGYYTGRTERHYLVWYGMTGDNVRQTYNNPNQLYRVKNNDFHDLFEATANYEFDVKRHNIKLLAGASYENYRNYTLYMFQNTTKIRGMQGTTYNASYVDKTYAVRLDRSA